MVPYRAVECSSSRGFARVHDCGHHDWPRTVKYGRRMASLAHHAGLGDSGLTRIEDGIVWQIRLPRALTAAAVGAGLAVSGAVMQALTRNSLADPFLLGLS